MHKKLPIEEIAYWGTFLFAAISMCYLLITLINLSSEEETALQSTTNYRDQTRYVTVLTSEGSFKVALMRSQAPVTIKNFVKLAQYGFYDNTVFYNFRDGVFVENADSANLVEPRIENRNLPARTIFEESVKGVNITRGLVAMPQHKNSKVDGRQILIFIEDEPIGVFGKDYVVFGRVIEGMDVIDRIRNFASINSDESNVHEAVALKSIVTD